MSKSLPRILRELTELVSPLTKLFLQALLIEEVLELENHKLISNLLNLPNVHKLMLHPFLRKAEKYRPVSLTCITCKLFEHIIC